jgi:glycosyltransferase involved in cell wall biosynthesis
VLPPKEGFSEDAVGAIGLLVRRLVRAGAVGIVVGRPVRGTTFADVEFRPAPPGWGLDGLSRYAGGVARVLRRTRPALIEVHNRPAIALRLARRFPRTPVLLWLNNDPQGMRGARTPAERARLMTRLARVVTASEWLRGRLLDGVDAPARDPVVLPNCIELPPPPRAERERLIVFAGRVVRDKGADSFVQACAEALPHLPGWRAEMLGADRFSADSPETAFTQALRPAAAAAGVAMRGYQPYPAVLDAMGRAAVVAVPSRWEEPFGLAALEAMACGAALVCSARGGLPEVAGRAALYADPDEPGALARALLDLATDAPKRAALAAAGRRRAEGFGAPAAARRLLALRREIVQDEAQ